MLTCKKALQDLPWYQARWNSPPRLIPREFPKPLNKT